MFATVSTSFHKNCTDVERLVNFDREVLQVVDGLLDDLHKRLKPVHASDQMNGGRVLTIVRGIRNNNSLRSNYSAIYGQAVVLLVSHFASALADIFRLAVSASLETEESEALLSEELRLTFREIKERGWNLKSSAADLLIAKKDYTFQDMQSTVRAFDSYVGVKLVRDQTTNNIILGQAARHVIVHASGLVTERMLRQVSGATPRTLRPTLQLGQALNFTPEEVLSLKSEMEAYIARTIAAVESRS